MVKQALLLVLGKRSAKGHSVCHCYYSPRTKNIRWSKRQAKHAASTSHTTTIHCCMQNSTDTVRSTWVSVGHCLLEDDSMWWNTRFGRFVSLGRCGVAGSWQIHLPTSLSELTSQYDDNITSFTKVATEMRLHNWYRDSRTSTPTVIVHTNQLSAS